jgi:hypothetical protein
MYHEMKYRLEVNIGFHSFYWHCCCYQNKEVPNTGRLSRRGIKSPGDEMQKRLTSRRGNTENTGSALPVL